MPICHPSLASPSAPLRRGLSFSPDGLSVAQKTFENFVARAIRLYEQELGEPVGSARLGLYVERWVRWTGAGLPEVRNALTTLCADRAV